MTLLRRTSLISFLVLLCWGRLQAETVAISSVVFNGYARQQLPDGTFKPEFYTFGEGGCLTRAIADSAMAKLKFTDIVKVVADPLARQNYRPALKSGDVGLLIVVFWGCTQGSRESDSSLAADRASVAVADYNRVKPADPTLPVDTNSAEGAALDSALWQMSLANESRDQLDDRNARILGFTESLDRARSAQHMSFAQDTFAEIGNNRYYVVLEAYDFKTAVAVKKLKPLWTTRISVSEGGDFAAALEKMVRNAAHYFGKASDGLQRHREGTVELAPLQILEAVPNPK